MIELSDEQRLLRESVDRFVREHYDFANRRRIVAADAGFSPEHWGLFAELGWLSAPFAEADGGLGGSALDTALIMEGLGRGLFAGPYLSGVVLAGGLVARGGDEPLRRRVLPGLMRGEQLLAFAFTEPQSRYNLADIETRAVRDGDGYRLSGRKSLVLYAASASSLVVSARTAGATRDPVGVSLFLVDRASPGLEESGYQTVDGHRASEVELHDVRVESCNRIGEAGDALPLIEAVCDHGVVALCAEAVGGMDALYRATLDYLKQREQFGSKLASFQALQHRMVDVYMALELSRSLTFAAARGIDQARDENERQRWASAAMVQMGKAGRLIGREAVQLHGGMGMTDDLAVGHYFQRLCAINALLGDTTHHTQRFAGVSDH